ncbi:Casein kinase I isoform delta [Mizuhopecten yessoensis]|uniref:non-specific serine/threonine protein kinase n=1 Tax=Mizuhopecten yessoensis TaxID=6573 RepID=A0A210QXI8_MIZYE|nr:Casein kinase I isoform delta [Mizuhopecten yessoensis]
MDEKLRNEDNETTYPLGVRIGTTVRRVGETGTIGVKNVVGNKYMLERKVGSGAYGQVFLGTDMSNGEKVAIKVNRYKTKFPGPSKEERIGDRLQNEQGFPVIRWSGRVGSHNVIVMDLLGHNLQTHFEHCFRRFSLKTVLLLADQLISRLEAIHLKGVVHNDMKPCNCMVGLSDKSHVIYLIDFGLSEHLRDRDTNQTLPHRGNVFTSINTHLRIQPSQRDDLESLGYMLLMFLRGGLPWQDVSGTTYRDTQNEILKKKQSIPVTDLCKGCPVEFAQYLTICRSLRFNDKPDYNYLRHLLKILFKRNNFTSDIFFDWDLPSGICYE